MDPFVGDEAEALARELGFERSENEGGTSILIVDTDLEAEDILRGVEDYWWPRIVDHKLQVDVIDAAGNRTAPQPIRRPHLKPFIDAWNVVILRSPCNRLANVPNRTQFMNVAGVACSDR